MKILISALALVVISSTALASVDKDVTLKCGFSEGSESKELTVLVENPYGAGKEIQFTTKSKKVITVSVRVEENSTDKKLIDLGLMISVSGNKSLVQLMARGLSEDKYKTNGLSYVVYADDQSGDISDSVRLGCALFADSTGLKGAPSSSLGTKASTFPLGPTMLEKRRVK